MTKLGLLTLAEVSVFLGLVAVFWLGYLDDKSLVVVFMVVIAAFFIPSLLAIWSERKANSVAR